MTFATAVPILFSSFVYRTNVYWSVIHGMADRPFWQDILEIRTMLVNINIRTLCLISSIYPRYSPSLLYFLLPPVVSLGMECSIFRAIWAMIYGVIINTQGTYDRCWIMVQLNNLQCASYFTIFFLYNAMSKLLTEKSKRISDMWYVLREKLISVCWHTHALTWNNHLSIARFNLL